MAEEKLQLETSEEARLKQNLSLVAMPVYQENFEIVIALELIVTVRLQMELL